MSLHVLAVDLTSIGGVASPSSARILALCFLLLGLFSSSVGRNAV